MSCSCSTQVKRVLDETLDGEVRGGREVGPLVQVAGLIEQRHIFSTPRPRSWRVPKFLNLSDTTVAMIVGKGGNKVVEMLDGLLPIVQCCRRNFALLGNWKLVS